MPFPVPLKRVIRETFSITIYKQLWLRFNLEDIIDPLLAGRLIFRFSAPNPSRLVRYPNVTAIRSTTNMFSKKRRCFPLEMS
ncbi:hypothetical protein RUND412_005003 [Rhizina undulata]